MNRLPTYDGQRYATLASGLGLQIDPEDAPRLGFGGWRYSPRPGVFCQKQVAGLHVGVKGQRKGFCLAHLIYQKARLRRTSTAAFVVYVNGDKTDLRRANLEWSDTRNQCPFDASRLRTLYWSEDKTLQTITALAAARKGVAGFPHETVRRWMKRAGVPSRKQSAATPCP